MEQKVERDISIIGMACRFPDANNLTEFWQNLLDAQSAIKPVPPDRWDADRYYSAQPNTAGKTSSKWGCFLDDVWGFDPGFFQLSAEDAPFIDPQHRLLLELAYEAIADAGITPAALDGESVGVFIGISQADYERNVVDHLFSEQDSPPTILANNLRNLAAGRIADSLNLKGPTIAFDSACASSLVALHVARLSLLQNECRYALVGGVNLNLSPTSSLAFSNAGALSDEPKSYLFDERNCGITLGEGGGMVLLGRSEDNPGQALAILKGSAVNNDGRAHGPMTPNTKGQQQVMRTAYTNCDVDPADLRFIEAHGTGTPIGDLVEARTLNRFFNELDEVEQVKRYVGSVKPNVGHLLSAAGMAGLIKTILALHHRTIPPSINCQRPHRRLRFSDVGLTVNTEPVEWDSDAGKPWLAGVNAFAFGGTNAHVVLQEAAVADRQPLPMPQFQRIDCRMSHSPAKPAPRLSRSLTHQDDWLHQVDWQPEPLQPVAPDRLSDQRPFVLTSSDPERAQEVVMHLTHLGIDCQFVAPDKLNLLDDTLRRLIILACGGKDAEFVWSVSKQLAQQRSPWIQSITFVTDGGGEKSCLGAADNMLASFSHALGAELHLPVEFISYDQEITGALLYAELIRPTTNRPVVWRANQRLVQNISPVSPEQQLAQPPLSADGVYLITGGGSGVGAAIAKGLALEHQPTLVLVGRTPLSKSAERRDLIEKLNWTGATAEYLAVDVTQSAEVDQLLGDVIAKFGRLDGVIHAAGRVEAGLLASASFASFNAILEPKMLGVQNLHAAVQKFNCQPGFFINFSSISAVLPRFSGGLSSYAAANGYLDGFAHQHGCQTINWTMWTESGEGAKQGGLENLDRLGLKGISDREGYDLFKAALGMGLQQTLIVNPAAAERTAVKPMGESGSALEDAHSQIEPVVFDGDKSDAPIAQIIVGLLADELEVGPDEVPHDQSFSHMGIDSMGAMELVAKLEEHGFGSLPATLFFEHNTVQKLAAHLQGVEQPAEVKAETLPEPMPKRDSSKLTPLQRSFLSQQLRDPEHVAYGYLRLSLKGGFDLEKGNTALKRLVDAHEQCRSKFTFDPGGAGAQQLILALEDIAPLPQIETISLAESGQTLSAIEDELVNRPIDLLSDEFEWPFRLFLIQDSGEIYHLVFWLHHIVGDGWSLSNLIQEFWDLYSGASITPPETKFSDYARLLDAESGAPVTQTSLDWWQNQLADHPFYPAPESPRGRHKAHQFKLEKSTLDHLKASARAADVTLFHWLLAAQFKALAAELEPTRDKPSLSIGVAESRRDYPLPMLNRVVGCMADLYPLGLTFGTQDHLSAVAQQVRDSWLDVHKHSRLCSSRLADLFPAEQRQSHSLPHAACFSFSHFPRFIRHAEQVELIDIHARTGTAQTTLSLVCWTSFDTLYFSWNYREDLYSADQIERLTGRLLQLLKEETLSMVDPPIKPVSESKAKQQPGSVPLFLAQINQSFSKRKYAKALKQPEVDYASLSNGVGHCLNQLKAEGFKAGDVVAYIGEPGQPALCALLATFWGGGTWLPLDPAAPKRRLLSNLKVGGATFLLGQLDRLPTDELPKNLRPVTLSACNKGVKLGSPEKRGIDQTAVIIFTSGSTGEQKGVPVRYGSLDLYLNWAVNELNYRRTDTMMWATSLSFDASLRQCLAPLMAGGSILPIGRELVLNLPEFAQTLVNNKVTKWSSVPTLFDQMVRFWRQEPGLLPMTLEQIQLGGEALPMELVDRWTSLDSSPNEVEFVNLYGPTENTINGTYCVMPVSDRTKIDSKSMPIGRPLPDVKIKVLDKNGKDCAVGERGELLLGGDLLAQKYMCADPKLKPLGKDLADGRYFPTGDLVEILPDQNLLFIGRIDHQVKLRGHRIELGEIEQALLSHPQVEQAAVGLVENDGSKTLIAQLVGSWSGQTRPDLRPFLADRLPTYMIPAQLNFVDQLPRFPNGKIDRRSIGISSDVSQVIEEVPGPGDVEAVDLAKLWRQLLKVEDLDDDSDFFALGGDSLHVMELVVLLKREGVPVTSVSDLFAHRRFKEQNDYLATLSRMEVATKPLPQTDPLTPFPLSPAQVGFWMARKLVPNASTSWFACFYLDGELDHLKFEQAVQIVVNRHPMLRTVLVPQSRPPLQKTLPTADFLPVPFSEVTTDAPEYVSDLVDELFAQFKAENAEPFDLTQAPLLKLQMVQIQPKQTVWFVAGDHFIGDGFSGWLFGRELLAVYDQLVLGQQPSLPALSTTFQEYIELANKRSDQIDAETQTFWKFQFESRYQTPVAWHQPAKQPDRWHNRSIEMSEPVVAALKTVAQDQKATLHDLLLLALYQQLVTLTDQTDLVIGTAISGRDIPLPDLMHLFGSFASILPIRFNPDTLGCKNGEWPTDMAQLLTQARSNPILPSQIAQLAHADTPQGAITGRQFLFSLMDFESIGPLESENLKIRWDLSKTSIAPVDSATDLLVSGRLLDGKLRLTFAAGGHAFDQPLFDQFVNRFQERLNRLVQPVGQPTRLQMPVNRSDKLNGQYKLRLDSALIGYLPDRATVSGQIEQFSIPLTADQVRDLLFVDQQPRLLDSLHCQLGRSGTVTLPYFADELAALPADLLNQKIVQAAEHAFSQGATSLALAGMLPSLTEYGFGLAGRMPNQVELTTGHSLTVVSVVKNLQKGIQALGSQLDQSTIGFLGLGSIGAASLRLFLSQTEHPAKLILCDVAANAKHLHRLKKVLQLEDRFKGEIELLHGGKRAPDQLYSADIIVGATSQANVLDIAQLRPGTLVVDDSFPHCFDVDLALKRMSTEKDVMVVGGGLLDIGSLERAAHVPPMFAEYGSQLLAQLPAFGMASCQLEGLLRARFSSLPVTMGLVEGQNVIRYLEAVNGMGFKAAPFHLGPHSVGLPHQVSHLRAR